MTTIEYKEHISMGDVHNNQDSIFVYEDTDTREGKFAGHRNAVGIRVKKSRGVSPSAYYTDYEITQNCTKIREDLINLSKKANEHGIKRIVFPSEGIGTGSSMLITIAKDTFDWLTIALKSMGITNGSKRNFDYVNKMTEDIARQPTGKFNPKYGFNAITKDDTDRSRRYKTINVGDGIVFTAMGGQTLTGYVIDINNKDTSNESYKVKLNEESSAAIKSRHTLASITGTIMDVTKGKSGSEMYKVKLTDGTIRAIRHGDINYKSNSGPVTIGDKVGFESSDIKVMIVPQSAVKSKIAIIPDEYHPSSIGSTIILDRKKSKMSKTKAKLIKLKTKLIRKPIRKPIKKIIKKSPIKKCKCKK